MSYWLVPAPQECHPDLFFLPIIRNSSSLGILSSLSHPVIHVPGGAFVFVFLSAYLCNSDIIILQHLLDPSVGLQQPLSLSQSVSWWLITSKSTSYIKRWISKVIPFYPTLINPYQSRSAQIHPDQLRSTQMNPNQPRSIQINPNQPKSVQINPYQPRSTKINLKQPRSIQIYLDQHRQTHINQHQPAPFLGT